jgi:hypothetical protein
MTSKGVVLLEFTPGEFQKSAEYSHEERIEFLSELSRCLSRASGEVQ